jgi:hypothetical protein
VLTRESSQAVFGCNLLVVRRKGPAMSEGQPNSSKPYDPTEPFRGLRDAYLDIMAKTMVEAVNSDAYAQASGAMLDTSLTMSAPFREALEKSMLRVLEQLSLPSRQEFVSLAERFTNIEMRLDDMDATLGDFENKLQRSMLPVVQQLLSLTEAVTELAKRQAATGATEAHLKPSPRAAVATPVAAKSKAASQSQPPAKGRTAAKRAKAAKTARKGAR